MGKNMKTAEGRGTTRASLLGGAGEMQHMLPGGRLRPDGREFWKWQRNLSLGQLGREEAPQSGGCIPVNELCVFQFCQIHHLEKGGSIWGWGQG